MSVTGTGASTQDFQFASGAGAESSPGGGFLWPDKPNIVDFLDFLRNSVQIPTAALPGTSPWPQYALTQAMGLVLQMGYHYYHHSIPQPVPIFYTLAVYNCATHILYTITPDVAGQNFFTTARSNKGYNLVNPSTGLVAAASDESTSSTLSSPEWASKLTIGQLGFFKTPWGREYLSYNQSYGPSIWGLS